MLRGGSTSRVLLRTSSSSSPHHQYFMKAKRGTTATSSAVAFQHQRHQALSRAFSTNPGGGGQHKTSPWLSDKSLYPLLAICGLTVVGGLVFGPYWLYKSPDNRVNPIRRRSTIHEKKPHESIPISDNMYKKSQELTKGIYRVTVNEAETVEKENPEHTQPQ